MELQGFMAGDRRTESEHPMPTSPAPGNSRIASIHERWREWLPGSMAIVALVGAAKLGQLADRHAWWFRGQYELLSLVIFALMTAALCLAILILVRVTNPQQSRVRLRRVLSTLFFVAVGLKVGGRYIHMCMAGSRLIEGLAMLGTPILAGTIVFACKRLVVGYVLAICVLAVIWLVARPYLDWAHGN